MLRVRWPRTAQIAVQDLDLCLPRQVVLCVQQQARRREPTMRQEVPLLAWLRLDVREEVPLVEVLLLVVHGVRDTLVVDGVRDAGGVGLLLQRQDRAVLRRCSRRPRRCCSRRL